MSAPTRPGSTSGNATTFQRWARRLSELGHEVIEQAHADETQAADVAIVLHAKRGAEAIRRYAALTRPPKIVVGFGGTDVYGDLADPDIVSSLALGDAFVVLQSLAADRLGQRVGGRVWVIHQAVENAPAARGLGDADVRQVVVLSHLRDVKDPLRAAEAACVLSSDVPIRVLHAGAAHDETWTRRAQELSDNCEKYQWLGELSRPQALTLLNESDALVLTSVSEGGANVVSEALALRKPIIASRIEGTVGMLGSDHPGYFEVGDTAGLARLLQRFALEQSFRDELEQSSIDHAWLVDPATERSEWMRLLASLG
ncbi:MAG: glycosyltransferase [Acidimicrobiales bacterium]